MCKGIKKKFFCKKIYKKVKSTNIPWNISERRQTKICESLARKWEKLIFCPKEIIKRKKEKE